MKTKRFDLRTVLSVTTGRLLTKSKGGGNGIDDIYKLLGWMTSDEPFTHQLGRFADECKPWLLRWFPDLARADETLFRLDEFIKLDGPEKGCESWISTLILGGLPEFLEVGKIPADDHVRKHPWDELVEMRGTDEGIIVL